jgi:sarcosine oxidase subunit gamma
VADDIAFDVGATMAGHYGAAESTGVTLAEATFAGAWNVQGNAEQLKFANTARALFGLLLPVQPNTTAREGALTALWLGPASWLLVGSHEAACADFDAKRDALIAAGGALFDVSASRVGWTIAGPHAMTALAKGCPLDFHPRVFAEGMCAQSVFGHVNALFYRHPQTPAQPPPQSNQDSQFTMLVARSFARDVWHALCLGAAQYGYDVGHPQPF